jgi:hypothetical protein
MESDLRRQLKAAARRLLARPVNARGPFEISDEELREVIDGK